MVSRRFVDEAPKGLLAMYRQCAFSGSPAKPYCSFKRGELDAIHVMRGKKKGLQIKAIPAHPTLFDVTS